jgi:hypothetical protein
LSLGARAAHAAPDRAPAPVDGVAQPLGTFYWRLAPYCNTPVLTVIQEGTAYRLQGYEDQCTDFSQYATVEGTLLLQDLPGESLAGTRSFVHVVEAGNRISNISCFSHALTDGNPDAVIVFSPSRGPATGLRPRVDAFLSLYYDDNGTSLPGALSNNVWCLSRNDSEPIPLGAGFNIHVVPRR